MNISSLGQKQSINLVLFQVMSRTPFLMLGLTQERNPARYRALCSLPSPVGLERHEETGPSMKHEAGRDFDSV